MAYVTKAIWCGLQLGVLVVLATPPAGRAQSTRGKRPEARTGTVEIEEITVTAQKREENIQEIPISVTAITSTVLEERGLSSYAGIGEAVPNLRVAMSSYAAGNVYLGMRGLATQQPLLDQNPPVGLYVDGVYIAKIRGANMDLEDLDRVEVLRGPQGTLYGRNTIGGAVSFVTQKPTEERSIMSSIEAGNYNALKGRVTLNVPVFGKNGIFRSDAVGTLSLRDTAMYKEHDNFIRNSGPAPISGFNNQNRIFNMASVRWRPSEDITVDYAFEYHRYLYHPIQEQTTMVYKGGPSDGGPFDLNPYVHKNWVDSLYYRYGSQVLIPGREGVLRPGDDGNHRLHILTGAWELGELGLLGSVTLKSISSYRAMFTDQRGAATIYGGGSFNRGNLETWSEELQWLGTGPRVHYVLGAYYYGEHSRENFYLLSLSKYGAYNANFTNFNKNSSSAVFGQLTWTPPIFSDKLSVTGGARYTQDQIHQNHVYTNYTYAFMNFEHSVGRGFGGGDMFTPMGDVSYQWTDNLMTYFRVSKGVQSGAVNGLTNDIRAHTMTSPEKLLAYEAGFKSQWFDNRVRLNADGFFSDYTDQVRNVIRPSLSGGGAIADSENVGKSEIWGSEVEMSAIPLRGLEATATYGFVSSKILEWTSPKYDQFGNPVFDQNNKPVLVNVADKFNPNVIVPEHTASFGLTYTVPPTSMGTLSAHIDIYWQDQLRWDNPRGPHPDTGWNYELVNGRLQFAGIPLQRGSLDLAVFGRNLFDRKYRIYGMDSPGNYASNLYGDPRTFGVGLTYHFTDSGS